ncbi:ABC transporter ATP-binding protein [Bacillus sp. TS-2]|nr:ABC transporter ATP-binding protein [Bacillus sp. TS-2]
MIELQNVSKKYGSISALKNINLTIPSGVCFGLVGPNGAGKSTLMKILANIIKEYGGKININSNKPYSMGYTPQDICLEETITASANLKFYGMVYGLKGKKLSERQEIIFKDMGLTERENSKVKTYSGGMKRRLNIGCALIHEPEIVILDEPTVGVDPQSRRHIFELIKKLKKQGKTIIYTSHYMEEIESLCDQVAFIDKGEIIEQGTINELLHRYSQPGIYIKGDIPELLLQGESKVEKDGGWVIQTDTPLETLAKLANQCTKKEIVPNQLSLVQPRLEDVFFTLTGTELRDNQSA